MAEAGQASSFDHLLNESRDLVCERLRAVLATMLGKADDSLTMLITRTQNREAQQPYQDTQKLLTAERHNLENEFQKAYLIQFGRHASLVKNPGQSFSELETSLSLVGEEDLEETLSFKDLATKLRQYCEEELTALDQRAGVLLGDANLQAEGNPFGPDTICCAYQDACHALNADIKVRWVLRRLFDDHVMDAVRSIYKEVNALLVRNSILPRIRYSAKKSSDKAKASGAQEQERAGQSAAGVAAAGEQSLFSLLHNLVGAQAAGPHGASGAGGGVTLSPGITLPPGIVILQGAELLGSLTKLQRGDASAIPGGLPAAGISGAAFGTTNVLRELRTSAFGAGLVQMDATTLDIVAMLFDQLFEDPNISAGLKGLIGRLQIPMLKVAIADKSFFAKKTHPARALLDSFGDVAVRLPPEFSADSPTFVHVEAIVQHVLDNFQDDIAVFDAARQQLAGIIAEHDRQVEARSQATAQRIAQTENLAAAKSAAEDEVKARVQAHKIPGPVLEFLVEQWLRLLLLAHAKSGRNGAEWTDAIAAMDQLLWSVEPKNTLEERRKLAATVPGLVKRLVAGMQAVDTDVEARERFMGELMNLHTELLEPKKGNAPEKTEAMAAEAKPAAPVPLDFSVPVTVKNPYGQGEVQVSNLEFTGVPVDQGARAAAKAALQSSLAVNPPVGMEMGRWVEFRPKAAGEEKRAAKLLFVSPKKTRYLFSDRRGKDILELTRAELARRLRTGEAVRLDEEPKEPLFDRIMTGLIGRLKTAGQQAAVGT